ncbi:uncharacterized protein [Onthophagus taurus]|uniref:uncharacterized protein n=1 Tax=Onthophagus taurus TaxID=166361 RepID=UPI0039BE2518
MKLIPTIFVAVTIIYLLKCIKIVDAIPTRVKIHVPTKIKKVYITKYVTIPEHHHYFHEKENEPEEMSDHDHMFTSSDLHGFSSYD